MTVDEFIEEETKGTTYKQWIVGFIATQSIFTFGLQYGWISPVISTLQSENSPSGYPLSSYEISFIAGGISTLAICSGVIFGNISDSIGRRKTMGLIVIPQILGFALKLISANPICLIASQACCGIAGGEIFCVVPVYVKEIAQDSIRGILGSSGILLQCLGTCIMYAMGAYMNFYTVLWIVVWLPIINMIALVRVPESPAFLVRKGKIQEATKIMAWLRGVSEEDSQIKRDISVIKNEISIYDDLPPVTWKSILSDKISRKALGLSFLTLTVMDLGGNPAILAFASVILKSAGVTIAPKLQAIFLPGIMTMGCLLSALTVDRFGRKPLIILSAAIVAASLAVLGAILLVQQQGGYIPPWLPVICIGVSLYANGQHLPLPFVVMSEIFSVQLRTKILGLLVTYGWSINASQTLLFTPISDNFGMHTLFFAFACFNALGVVMVWIFLPETKSKTLEQIQKELRER